MPDEADFATVVARVQLLGQTAIDPALTTQEVEGIVRATARATSWVANTAYAFGAYVIPKAANLNGRRYRVIVAGTSHATTEPTWPAVDYGTVTDGTVTFEEAGPHAGSVYDIRKAVHECLALRYARDQLIDGAGDGQNIRGSQRAERIHRLMMSYRPLELA